MIYNMEGLAGELDRRLLSSLQIKLPVVVVCGDGGLGKSSVCSCWAAQNTHLALLSADGYMPPRQERQRQTLGAWRGDEMVNYDVVCDLIGSFKCGFGAPPRITYDHSVGVARNAVCQDKSTVLIVDGSLAGAFCPPSLVDFYVLFDAPPIVRRSLRAKSDAARGYREEEFQDSWKVYSDIYDRYIGIQRQRADILVDISERYQFMVSAPASKSELSDSY